jgi:hypothetical protein
LFQIKQQQQQKLPSLITIDDQMRCTEDEILSKGKAHKAGSLLQQLQRRSSVVLSSDSATAAAASAAVPESSNKGEQQRRRAQPDITKEQQPQKGRQAAGARMGVRADNIYRKYNNPINTRRNRYTSDLGMTRTI